MKLKKEVKLKAEKEFRREVSRKCYRKALKLVAEYRITNVTKSKGTIKEKYGIKEKDFKRLNYIEVDNPYYKTAGKMKLYLLAEVENKFIKVA